MKDLSPLQYFFVFEVAYSLRGYLLSHSKYVEDILELARLTNNKTIDTPIVADSDRFFSRFFQKKLPFSKQIKP